MHDPDNLEELVVGSQRGDRDAFTALVRWYQGMVVATARGILGDEAEAEDVAQEAFLQAFRHLGRLRRPASFRAWLLHTVVRLCLSRRRRAGSPHLPLDQVRDEDLPPSLLGVPEQELLRAELARGVREGLRQLTEKERIVLILREMDGLKYEEIARAVGVPVGTVRSRLHAARQALGRYLAERGLAAPRPPRSKGGSEHGSEQQP